ncbi:MAG: aldehyde ferredoxin oxidoreductase family protein, partial [Spirochaetales bacterium]|nr:aldehyde ferredoxin oxidoreductase family protein [Spirochaetales bacterium]
MRGVNNTLLNLDLSTGTSRIEGIPEELHRRYLGGYGLGAALLLDRMDGAADPLGPENILGFAAGILTGTGAYIASRFMVFGKSPSTGGWGDANCGAYFGKALKSSGFDAVLLSGAAENPVYILLSGGTCRVLPAADLWGLDTCETEEILLKRHPGTRVACIGPAGERLSMIAGISTDQGRYAARSALGAVMGSKNVKALVAAGGDFPALADPEAMKELRKKHRAVFHDTFPDLLRKYGTPMFYNEANKSGDTPFRNWAASVDDMEPLGRDEAEEMLKYQTKRYGCSGCPVACGGHVEVKEGPFRTDGPVHKAEYETLGIFGANLFNTDIESIIRINDLCNRYGMDTIGCGGLCAFATECYEKGIITPEHTGGLKLTWGDPEALVRLVEMIGKAEGLGAILSRGFEYAVSVFGEESRKYVMAVRNEGLPAHDPRWGADLALTYYSDATPARHTQGCTVFPAAGYTMPEGADTDPAVQARAHRDNVGWYHALSSLGLCLFGFSILDYHTVPDFLSAATGAQWTPDELLEAGLRIHLARHLFNLRAGIKFTDYPFPERVLGKPPLKTGETKGV